MYFALILFYVTFDNSFSDKNQISLQDNCDLPTNNYIQIQIVGKFFITYQYGYVSTLCDMNIFCREIYKNLKRIC